MRILVRLACLLAVAVTACSPARDASTPEARAALFDEFRRGDTALTCTIPCISAWLQSREQMRALDSAGEWRPLAILVASTGYTRDLGYYYLGRAADGLNLPDAAGRYYRQSYALATSPAPGPRCAANPGDCNGVDLLAVLPARLEGGRPAGAGTRLAAASPGRRSAGEAGGATPTPTALRQFIRQEVAACGVPTIKEIYRGPLAGMNQPVVVATHFTDGCGLGNMNRSSYGVYYLDNAGVRDLRDGRIVEESVGDVKVVGGQIVVVSSARGPNDARCCPTLETTEVFAVQNGALIKVRQTTRRRGAS